MTRENEAFHTRILVECEHMVEIVARIRREWGLYTDSLDDAYVDAVALNLQALYTGIEKVLLAVLRCAGSQIPEGKNWHAVLLADSVYHATANPAGILSKEQKEALDEYRAFRHIARNVYAFNFNPRKIEKLVKGMDEIVPSIIGTFRQAASLLSNDT